MGILWFNSETKNKNLIATIYDTNITLNKNAADLIGDAYKVMLGIDYEKKTLFIKPLNKDSATRGTIPLSSQYNITIRSSYGRISNVEFVKEIKNILGVSSLKDQPKKFHVEYQSDYLMIDLLKEA